MIKLCFNLTAVLHWRREYFEDFIEGSKSFGKNFAVDFVEDLFQRCREATDQAKLTRRTMLLAVLEALCYFRCQGIGTI